MSKYGNRAHNWFEAIVNKLGGEENGDRFLRDELMVFERTCLWREEDGVIYFSVTSDGTTGEDWITRLESKGSLFGNYDKQVLRSLDFKPTNGVTTEVAVFKGILFEDNERTTKKIRAYVEAFRISGKRKMSKPNAEIAYLIREKFTNKEIEQMGLAWIVTMHEPINNFDGVPCLLVAGYYDDDPLFSVHEERGDRFDRDYGFAFAVSQTSAEK